MTTRPHVDTPTSRCRVGIARADVTPPVGIYHRLWGAATHDRATGVHRPIYAAAVVLEPLEGPTNTDQGQVLIVVDHCIFWEKEMREMLSALADKSGVPSERIIFCFSHTHSAGLMGNERANLPGGDLIAPYLKSFTDTLAKLIRDAQRDLEPVTIDYGVGHSAMAAQRDFWDEETKQFVCGFNPRAKGDPTIIVGRITSKAGKAKGVIVNYACHPTTLAWGNTLLSPDFVGGLYEVVEKETGAPCLFLQGASGDMGPREGFVGDTKVADRNGKQLGHGALEAYCSLPPPGTRFVYQGPVISGATIGTWAHEPLDDKELREKSRWQVRRITVPLPYKPEVPTRAATEAELRHWKSEKEKAQQAGDTIAIRDAHAMIERHTRWLTRIESLPTDPQFPMPVTLIRAGDAVWVFVEGEHYHYLQTTLRGRFPGTPILVSTIANGSRCIYLSAADAYGKSIYQETVSVLAQGTLETLTDAIASEIDGLLGPR